MIRSYNPKRRLPKAEDANELGYVFARRIGRMGHEGTQWRDVSPAKHDSWMPANKQWMESVYGPR